MTGPQITEDLSRLPIERAGHLAELLASLAAGPTPEVVDHLRSEIDGHLEAHRFTRHHAGDGYTSPREEWATCSCGASLFDWSEAYGTSPIDPGGDPAQESPEVGYAVHLAAVLLGVYPTATRCTSCGHRHDEVCDAPVPARSEDGDDEYACGCLEPESPTCRHCGRGVYPGPRHGVLAGTSGPDDSPEPEFVCLDVDGEVIAPTVVVPDPWATMGPVPPPPF